jgi:hypothetical protein
MASLKWFYIAVFYIWLQTSIFTEQKAHERTTVNRCRWKKAMLHNYLCAPKPSRDVVTILIKQAT